MLAADNAASAFEHALTHDIHLGVGDDLLQQASLAVVFDDRQSLPPVGAQAVFDRILLVIFTHNQFAAVMVTDTFFGRFIVLDVVGGLAGGAEASARCPVKYLFIRDVQINNTVKRAAGGCEYCIQSIGLGDCSGESIQDKAVHGVTLIEPLLDDRSGDIIRDQSPLVDNRTGNGTQCSLIYEMVTEKITGGKCWY